MGRLPTLVALGALALWLTASSGRAARAEPPGQAGRSWIFDVRIVRVDLGDGTRAEQRPAFQAAERGTTEIRPEAVLAALQARGTTRLLLDQRITTMHDMECTVEQQSAEPQLVVQLKDGNSEQQRSTIVQTGASVGLQQTAESLRYAIQLNWSTPAQPSVGSPVHRTSWKGSHPGLAGRTLVLHYAQQHAQGSATEIYVLIRAQEGP